MANRIYKEAADIRLSAVPLGCLAESWRATPHELLSDECSQRAQEWPQEHMKGPW